MKKSKILQHAFPIIESQRQQAGLSFYMYMSAIKLKFHAQHPIVPRNVGKNGPL